MRVVTLYVAAEAPELQAKGASSDNRDDIDIEEDNMIIRPTKQSHVDFRKSKIKGGHIEAMPKATKLLAIAETPLVSLASETKEATTSEFLPCSPENEELIAPVMSLFFCDEDEDDNEEAEDATATAVATKDATPPIVTIAVPETPKIPAMPLL
ncbi:hypothetical protein ACJX0J_020415, partial [Zea mays]